ncbi:MAG: efflux RND transporter periplasmic adaptor subunit [bacterium]|nr:efflux RND transporter periplasmic adaptor subunit [bacterium]
MARPTSYRRIFLSTGMTLVLLSACEEAPQKPPPQATVPVRSEVVSPGPFRANLTLLGKVEPAVRLELRVTAGGTIRYAPRFAAGLRTGERVAQGESLFTLENDNVRLKLAEAEIRARSAEAELERTRQGVEGGVRSLVELKQAEIEAELTQEQLTSARLQAERLSHAAPIAGVLWVVEAPAPASEIAANTLVAEIAGDGRLRVTAATASSDLERLERGLEVSCLRPGTGDVVGRGTVTEVARQVDRSGTVPLVATVTEDLDMPPPGEGLELKVWLTEKSDALTLPEEAVLVDGGAASVFVLDPSGTGYKARRQFVRPGSRADGRIEILDGLNGEERIAVRGAEFLADGLPAVEAETEGDD